MSGHLEQAAAALGAASQAVPVDLVMGASNQIDSAVAAIQQAGAEIGQELTGLALSIKNELDGSVARLAELRQRLESAAQSVMRGGY